MQNIQGNPYEINKGDLMYFVENNEVHHATIISSVGDGEIRFSGNTRRRFDYKLSDVFGDNEYVYIIRLKDNYMEELYSK